jgi:hypothetical protein
MALRRLLWQLRERHACMPLLRLEWMTCMMVMMK